MDMERDEYNNQRLNSLGPPITRLAIHSTSAARSYSGDSFRGLENTIYLCEGADIILTTNIWINAGLVNGATGNVKDIIYASGQGREQLSMPVVVHFPNYIGPQFLI